MTEEKNLDQLTGHLFGCWFQINEYAIFFKIQKFSLVIANLAKLYVAVEMHNIANALEWIDAKIVWWEIPLG